MGAGYYVILAPGNLYNALVSEDWNMFRKGILNYAIAASAVLVLKVLRGLLRESAANLLREKLTTRLHDLYFGSSDLEAAYGASPYYQIATERRVDNPDQRIATDSRDFSSSLINILCGPYGQDVGGVLEATASILLYTRTTWLRTGWFGLTTGYLWSFIVSLVSIFVINRTSPFVFKQEQLEADFRYSHAHLRRHAEEIAFLRGAPFEHRSLDNHLRQVIRNKWKVIFRHFYLNFIQYGFSYYISIVMYITLAVAVHTNAFSFSSTLTAGEKAKWISQTGSIFIQLLFSFTMFINLGTPVSDFVANVDRLSVLLDALQGSSSAKPLSRGHPDTEPLLHEDGEAEKMMVFHDETEGISADHVFIHPSEERSIGPISFNLKKGQWLLIKGETGSGKTSILRVLRGLWAPSRGTVRIPNDEKTISFVPQMAYISLGEHSLREVVMYPNRCTGDESETERICEALQAVGWRRGVGREDVESRENWATQLSPGETQLLAACRVIVARPTYAILDEPTASLDSDSERRVLRAIRELGVSAITVGHSQSLPAQHDHVIYIPRS